MGEKGVTSPDEGWFFGQILKRAQMACKLKVMKESDIGSSLSPPRTPSLLPWVPQILMWRIPSLSENTTTEVIPWSRQVPPREPCYLVELLDQGWFERNAFGPRKVSRRPKPPPTAVSLAVVPGLLRQTSNINCNGNNQARLRAPSPEEVGLDEMESQSRGRMGRGSRGRGGERQEKRSSSVDAVRLARLGENGAVERWDPPLGFQKRSMTVSGGTLADDLHYRPQIRCKSLTDTDLEELQGFMDLGFQFPREQTSPEMTETLPALKLYHAVESVQHRLISTQMPAGNKNGCHQQTLGSLPLYSVAEGLANSSPPIHLSLREPWMLPTLDDHPANVKMHLRVWARTVASAVRQAC